MDWWSNIQRKAGQSATVTGQKLPDATVSAATEGALKEQYSQSFAAAANERAIRAKQATEDKSLAFEKDRLAATVAQYGATNAQAEAKIGIEKQNSAITSDYYKSRNALDSRRLDQADSAAEGTNWSNIIKGVGGAIDYAPKVMAAWDKFNKPSMAPDSSGRIGVGAGEQSAAIDGSGKNPWASQGYSASEGGSPGNFSGNGPDLKDWDTSSNPSYNYFKDSVDRFTSDPNFSYLDGTVEMSIPMFESFEDVPMLPWLLAPASYDDGWFMDLDLDFFDGWGA